MRRLALAALACACACSDRLEPPACTSDFNCIPGTICASDGFCGPPPACAPPFERNGSSCTVSRPTAVTAVGGRRQVQVRWAALAGATSYFVGRGSVAGGPYLEVGNPATESFLDTGLDPATSYWYVVRALGPGGTGSYSDEAVALTVPDPPATLTATGGAASISLGWSAVAGATGYTITRSAGGAAFTVLAGSTTTSYVDSGLPSAATYSYEVLALDSTGPSAPSPSATASTAP